MVITAGDNILPWTSLMVLLHITDTTADVTVTFWKLKLVLLYYYGHYF